MMELQLIHVLSHHPLWLDSAPLHRPQCRLIVVYRCTCELSASIIILLSHPPHIQRDRYTTVPFDATSNHAQILIRWQTHLSVYLMEITCRRPSSSLSAQFNGNGNSVNGLRWYRTSFLPTSSQSYYGPPATLLLLLSLHHPHTTCLLKWMEWSGVKLPRRVCFCSRTPSPNRWCFCSAKHFG